MKKKSIIALSGLLVVGLVGGTFAYWSQTSTIDNPFDTGDYGTSLIENFSPEDGEDWEPGATITKEVYVTNDGDYDLIVRAKLDESWTYEDETGAYKENAAESADQVGDVGDVYTVNQADANDGLTATDDSVVAKTFSTSANWVDGGDGWYYYTVNVTPGESTDYWLTAVTLDEDVDMGVYTTTTYVSIDEGDSWIEYTEDEMPTYIGISTNNVVSYYYDADSADAVNPANITIYPVTNNKSVTELSTDAGYSNSDYVLTITVETVQATEDAVESVFGIDLDEVSITYDDLWTYYTD